MRAISGGGPEVGYHLAIGHVVDGEAMVMARSAYHHMHRSAAATDIGSQERPTIAECSGLGFSTSASMQP